MSRCSWIPGPALLGRPGMTFFGARGLTNDGLRPTYTGRSPLTVTRFPERVWGQ
jgi:hypothetical protein